MLNSVYLGPMVGTALEVAIEQPAIVQGASLQPKLLAQILQDVAEEENCLPLLEFALFELWERQIRSGPLTPNSGGTEPKREVERALMLGDYRRLGGIAGALDVHAEGIYKQLAIQKREHWVRRVMLRLVRTGEGTKDTRQRQYKTDLSEMAKDDSERESIEAVINALVNGRLLVSDRIDNQDVIDLSHEALMRWSTTDRRSSWKRLVTWREGDRELRRIVDAIEDARRAWSDKGKKRRDLLEGRLLKDSNRLLKEAAAEVFGAKGFIRKSLWWRRSELMWWLIIPTLILGLPAEHFLWEESVKRDYDRISRLENGDPSERAAVLNIAEGCWAEKQFSLVPQQQIGTPEYLYKLDSFLKYFRERTLKNCRSLQNVQLEKANLEDVHLNSAILTSVNLRGANLRGANLSDARLWFANLSDADLMGAYLIDADLSAANLSGAKFHGAILRNTTLEGVNLRGSILWNANLNDANLMGADLSSSILANVNLKGANLKDSNLKNATFKCSEYTNEKNQLTMHNCPNIKDIKWDEKTNWNGIKGWENVENIPPALKQQLGLKDKKEDGGRKTEEKKK